MPEFPPRFPPFPPQWIGGETYKWKQVLSKEEEQFIVEELVAAGFLRVFGVASDREIAGAIEADFRDMEHNGNRPWDPDFTELCKKLNNILEKIGYYLVIDYEVRKLG